MYSSQTDPKLNNIRYYNCPKSYHFVDMKDYLKDIELMSCDFKEFIEKTKDIKGTVVYILDPPYYRTD